MSWSSRFSLYPGLRVLLMVCSLDTAVAHDAKGAKGYEILFNAIRGGCKAAIWLSSRV